VPFSASDELEDGMQLCDAMQYIRDTFKLLEACIFSIKNENRRRDRTLFFPSH
jgi:hypothetical protein